MHLLASTISADPDSFDLCLIVAVVLFAVAAIVSFVRASVVSGFAFAGAALVALAWTFTS